jgi:hypothetical protein
MNSAGRMVLSCRRLLLGWAVAVVLAAGLSSTAFAKGDDLPLNARISGAAGARTIDFVAAVDPTWATVFSDEVADMEPMAPTLVFGPGPAGRRAPGLTIFYEIDFAQPLAAYRFPWNGMTSPHFYFYPARGGIPAYVRLHVTRGSQPAVDGWIPAQPEFTNLVTPYLDGLSPLQPAAQRPAPPIGLWWLGPVLVLGGASVLLLRRVGYFMPVVAMPRTK